MITRDQCYQLYLFNRKKEGRELNFFSALPPELLDMVCKIVPDDNASIQKALHLAASSEETDIIELKEMVQANPRLLLEAGTVKTRAGIICERFTLFEFLLAEGDADVAALISPFFDLIHNGSFERLRQYQRYEAAFAFLYRKVQHGHSFYDLEHLFNLVKDSSPESLQAAKDMTNTTDPLVIEYKRFRTAVRAQAKVVGLNFEHYTTLYQALNLFINHWTRLLNTNSKEKNNFLWRYVIGYLQRCLPAVDRCAFSRRFEVLPRDLKFIGSKNQFPDFKNDSDGIELNIGNVIYGSEKPLPDSTLVQLTMADALLHWEHHIKNKFKKLKQIGKQALQAYQASHPESSRTKTKCIMS